MADWWPLMKFNTRGSRDGLGVTSYSNLDFLTFGQNCNMRNWHWIGENRCCRSNRLLRRASWGNSNVTRVWSFVIIGMSQLKNSVLLAYSTCIKRANMAALFRIRHNCLCSITLCHASFHLCRFRSIPLLVCDLLFQHRICLFFPPYPIWDTFIRNMATVAVHPAVQENRFFFFFLLDPCASECDSPSETALWKHSGWGQICFHWWRTDKEGHCCASCCVDWAARQ